MKQVPKFHFLIKKAKKRTLNMDPFYAAFFCCLQFLPRPLGWSCLFLFHMMTQNITKFYLLQYLAATRCRFLTLFIEKMD